ARVQRPGGAAAGVRGLRSRRHDRGPRLPLHPGGGLLGDRGRPQLRRCVMDWIRALDTLRDQGHPAVLVTLTDVHGHAPRDPGAKLVVSAIGRWGSVGGGNLEAGAVARAEAMLREGLTRPEFLEFGLNEHVPTVHGRQCCGGKVQLLLEPVPVRPTVAVFGLGHVGYEVARIVSRLDVQLHLVDTRSGVLTAEQEADLRTGPARIWRHQPLVPEAVLELL